VWDTGRGLKGICSWGWGHENMRKPAWRELAARPSCLDDMCCILVSVWIFLCDWEQGEPRRCLGAVVRLLDRSAEKGVGWTVDRYPLAK
jgi:hypothetical protein